MFDVRRVILLENARLLQLICSVAASNASRYQPLCHPATNHAANHDAWSTVRTGHKCDPSEGVKNDIILQNHTGPIVHDSVICSNNLIALNNVLLGSK